MVEDIVCSKRQFSSDLCFTERRYGRSSAVQKHDGLWVRAASDPSALGLDNVVRPVGRWVQKEVTAGIRENTLDLTSASLAVNGGQLWTSAKMCILRWCSCVARLW